MQSSGSKKFTGNDLYYTIVAANVELQNLLSLLLSIYADEYALTNQPVAGTNELHTLLSTHIEPLEKSIKPYVCKKLFTSKKCDKILSLVDAKKLDSSLLFDILLKVEDILSIDHTDDKCKRCKKNACCTGCNHISPGCKKCKGNNCTPTKKRLHPCQGVSCTKILQDCKKHKMICCTLCDTCIACNKTRFESDVKAILSNPSTLSTSPSTCPWYMFIHSLEVAKCFRDLFGHVTVEECKEFVTTGVALNEEFKNCGTPLELEAFLQLLFQKIVAHAKAKLQDVITKNDTMVPSLSPGKVKELNIKKERLDKTMDNLLCIFEHGEFLNKYLADNCSKIKEIFMDDQRFHDQLEVLVTRFKTCLEEHKEEIIASGESNKKEVLTAMQDKERQDDRYKKVKVVRRLNKGFVLKLPLEKHEEVKVEYKRDNDGDENWKEVDADQKRYGRTVYLRVEGLPHSGDFQIRLTVTSEGVTKQEIPINEVVIGNVQWRMSTADGYLTFVVPPNRSDKDLLSYCARHLDHNNCMQRTTTLAIKVVNDDECDDGMHNGESDKEMDDEYEDETNYVSDDESTQYEELNAGKFSEKGLCYLERNFVKFEDVITFPPLNVITDDLTRDISNQFAKLLEQESKPGLKVLLINYDDSKFSQFIRVAEVKELFEAAFPASNRLLLFYSRFATIVNARIVKQKANIHQEMANCINDLKLFSCTFKAVINNNIIVTALLVCPYLSRAEVEEEMDFYFNKEEQSKRLMQYFFLTKDELESNEDESNKKENKLKKWWYFFLKRLKKIFESIRSSINGEILSEMFKRISGQCMATIACCDLENKSMLPTTSDDPQKQILTLLLSSAQLNATYALEKKKLVFGAFGCGKSVIAESVVRNIYEEALTRDKKCLIVYAIQDDHSLLEVKNRRFVDGLKVEMKQKDTGVNGGCSDDLVSIESGTFHSLAGQNAVGSNSLLKFVKSIITERNAFRSINLVIDEVDHNSIEGEDGIEKFKKLLNSIDCFVIFPRSAYLQVQLPGEEKQESNLHRLGLKPYPLEVVMRNSVEIVNLAESSQKTVKKSKSIFQYPSTPSQNIDEPKLPKIPKLSETSISENLQKIEKPQEEMNETMQLDNVDISTEHDKKEIKVSVNLLSAAKHIDKQKSSSSKRLELGSTFIECIPGHKVMKRKPNLINLPEAFELHSDNGAKILSVVLDKICLKDFNPLLKSPRGRYQSAIFDSPTIICNEVEEVNITYYALTLISRLQDCCIVYAPDLRRKYFSWKDKEPIYDAVKLENKILIGDNCSMRGMESRHVITFINPLAKFDRYVLPEVVTRANVSLDIISFPVNKTARTEKAGTLEDVVNNWLGQNKEAKQKLVEVTDVTTLLDSVNQDEICSKEKDHLIIHVQSRKFEQYGHGHSTLEQFLIQKEEELSTEELKETDIESAFGFHSTKLTEDNIGNEIVQTKDILQAGQTITHSKLDYIIQNQMENHGSKEASSEKIKISEKTATTMATTTTDDHENDFRLLLVRRKIDLTLQNEMHKTLPRDPILLCLEFERLRQQIQKLLRKKKISKEDFDLLLPANGRCDSAKYDASLLRKILYNFCGHKKALTKPEENDKSPDANIYRLIQVRNSIQNAPIPVSEPTYQRLLKNAKQPLIELGCPLSYIERDVSEREMQSSR